MSRDTYLKSYNVYILYSASITIGDISNLDITEAHKNVKLIIDGTLYNVDEYEFVKPGKGRAIYKLKLRNLLGEGTVDRVYHSGDKVEIAPITTSQMQYLYKENEKYVFMDNESYEQLFISENQLGDRKSFLKDGMVVEAMVMNDKLVDITLPNFVELKVVKSETATKKETISPQAKLVILETGHSIGVPTFIKEGDILKVDTRSGNYVERVGTSK